MYKCPHTGNYSFGVIHFIGEEGASSYSPEYFAAKSEHIELATWNDGAVYSRDMRDAPHVVTSFNGI